MFACPVSACPGKSENRQGVVAHLRMVHKMERPERDALMATLAPVVASAGAAPADKPAPAPKPERKPAAAPKSDFGARIERWLAVEVADAR